MKQDEKAVMKAVALCFKDWLKPEEAYIYTHLKKSALASRCKEYGIHANKNGYYCRKELDLIMSGGPTKYEIAAEKIPVTVRKPRR